MIENAPLIPAETLFVDDAKSNIEVGQGLGFHTYQPENGEDWREACPEYTGKVIFQSVFGGRCLMIKKL